MNLHPLTQPAAPWLHLLSATPPNAWDALRSLPQAAGARWAARFIRGRKARTVNHFFDECSAALQFPPYFGENWDACYDCLADLSWLHADGVIVCITDAVHLLDGAPAEQIQRCSTVLGNATQLGSQPRPPKTVRPLHVVFQATPLEEAALLKRWEAAGVHLNRLGS